MCERETVRKRVRGWGTEREREREREREVEKVFKHNLLYFIYLLVVSLTPTFLFRVLGEPTADFEAHLPPDVESGGTPSFSSLSYFTVLLLILI